MEMLWADDAFLNDVTDILSDEKYNKDDVYG